MLLQSEGWWNETWSAFVTWFADAFPELYDFIDTIGGMIGLTVLFLIPGLGGGLALILFLLFAIFGGLGGSADLTNILPILIPAIIAFGICVFLIVISIGILIPLWGINAAGLLLLILLLLNMVTEPANVAVACLILSSALGLGIFGNKKTRRKMPNLCVSFGDKKRCIRKEKGE